MRSSPRVQILIILLTFVLFLMDGGAASGPFRRKKPVNFENGFTKDDSRFFKIDGEGASIHQGAFQLTPDTINAGFVELFQNKSGRIMYHEPFRLWKDPKDERIASFNSSFLINVYRQPNWTAGQGMAFLLAPDYHKPEGSHGQWLGLTNSEIDGNPKNQIVAVEFDTTKEDFDPNDNHLGLDINSVKSNKTVSLSPHNITISPVTPANYSVWVDYDGLSKVLEVYMVDEGQRKPQDPLLRETIDLRNFVNRDSYIGFSASTGYSSYELHCVLKWTLEIDDIPSGDDKKRLAVGLGAGVPILSIAAIICGIFCIMRRKKGEGSDEANDLSTLRLTGIPREFKYKELKNATNNFDESLRLGEGGFGIVYRGVLHEKHRGIDSTKDIAVKRFSRDSIKSKGDFLAELRIIHRLRHKNLVRLVGWCYERGKLLLVYDFMPNGSLENHLYEAPVEETLSWSLRYKILNGIALALHYLHAEFDQKVVHRDLKASNILLDTEYNAKLGDFGLARALEDERNSYAEMGLAGVPGTMGYVAPECFHTGSATPESDVYGFGAVVLEVVCGRRPARKIEHEGSAYTLVDWVWMHHREGKIEDAVDERLGGEFEVEEAKKLLLLGLACSHPVASERPQTESIPQIINGTLPVPPVPPFKPIFTWPSMQTPSTISSILSSYGTKSNASLQEVLVHPPV